MTKTVASELSTSIEPQELLAVFDSKPSFYLVEGQVTQPRIEVPSQFDGASPGIQFFQVAFQSLAFAQAEIICQRSLQTGGGVIVREEFISQSGRELNALLQSSPDEAADLAKAWYSKVTEYIITATEKDPKQSVEVLLVKASDQFRLSYLALATLIENQVKIRNSTRR